MWKFGIKYHGNLPCSKLPWYFYNTAQKYHGILTLEKGGTMVNYRGIFITLAPGTAFTSSCILLNGSNQAWARLSNDHKK
jgi:hypothetical protein